MIKFFCRVGKKGLFAHRIGHMLKVGVQRGQLHSLRLLGCLIFGTLISCSSDFADFTCKKVSGSNCFVMFPTDKEKLFVEKIQKNKSESIYFVELEKVFNTDFDKVCLQTPYETKAHFEKKSKTGVNYYEINDDRNILWLFYKNGDVEKLNISYDLYMSENLVEKLGCKSENLKLFF